MALVKDRTFYREVIAICIPATLQSLISMAVSMLDNVMLGTLGETAISASALSNQIFFFFMILNFGLAGGYSVLMAQFWGKGDAESINRCLAQCQRIAMGMGILFFAMAQTMPDVLLRIFTPDPAVIEQGCLYLRIVSWSFIGFAFSNATFGALRSIGNVNTPLAVLTASFIINLVFNYLLIFGKFGFPRMGVAGAAAATLISRSFEFVASLVIIFAREPRLRYRFHYLLHWDMTIFRHYLKGGIAVLVSDALLAGGSSALSVIMGHMGSEMVAANSIASVLGQLGMVFNAGFNSAGSILIGHAVGAGLRKEARDRGLTLTLCSFVVGILAGVLIFVGREPLMTLYEVSDLTDGYAMSIMLVMALIMPFQTVGGLLSKGVLRGGGDTRFLVAADTACLWLLSIPLGVLSGLVWGWPVAIVYFFLRIDEILKCFICFFRLLGTRWIRDVTVG